MGLLTILPGQRQERQCDGRKPICETCTAFGERFCSWSTAEENGRSGNGTSKPWNDSDGNDCPISTVALEFAADSL